MQGLDRWLTTDPREKSAAEEEAYEEWVEDQGLDPDEDHWEAFEEYQVERAEDDAIERAREAYEERGWW